MCMYIAHGYFGISGKVWILIILNNQHMMPALILQRMFFTAGSSAGFSLLRPIMSVTEPWSSEHPLFRFLRALAAKCCMGPQDWHTGLQGTVELFQECF